MFEKNFDNPNRNATTSEDVKDWNWQRELEKRREKNNNFPVVDFSQPKKILFSLENGKFDFVDQILILEKAIANKKIGVEELKKMFNDTKDNNTRLAIIEAGSKISDNPDDKERKKWVDFLSDFGQNYNENIYTSRPIGDYWKDSIFVPEEEEIDYFLATEVNVSDARYRASNENSEILISAAISSLAKFGKKGENGIVKILSKNIEEIYRFYKNFPPGIKIENQFIDEYGEYESFIEDERGNILSPDGKEYFDPYYFYNYQCFQKMIEVGSRISVDYAINFLDKYNYLIHIYHQELKNILELIDKSYAAEKMLEKIGTFQNDFGWRGGIMVGDIKEHPQELAERFGLRDYPKTKLFILYLSDLLGTEELRFQLENKINKFEKEKKDPKPYQVAHSLITPIKFDQEAIANLQKFYQEKIKFEEYDVNRKMNEKEVALLEELIEKDEKVLEMGCGTGRLLLEMQKKGFDISGYDFTDRHVKHIKEKSLETNVFQGDWHNNAIKDESFETVYSLGRNILHDYSLVDQVQLFREAAQILKPGGKFIFDIPNREKGGYKMLVEEYAQEMENRGIQNFRYGAIYDSPDGKNFATRYAYSYDDVLQLAQISGFRIEEVKKMPLETGKDDENLYYVLEKIR